MNSAERENQNCGSELARDSARPERGYVSLRHGRWSHENVTYFVTFCTMKRKQGLTSKDVIAKLGAERTAMESDGTWAVRSSVVMPDHLHVLFDLGARLSLGRTIARFKGKTAVALAPQKLAWQPGYFEHRLRSFDEVRPTLYYILMNPVLAGLCARGEAWPGYYCGPADWAWFGDYARDAVSEPGWLAEAELVASKLAPTASGRRPPP